MGAGTFDLAMNGSLIRGNQPHGVTTGRGIGRVTAGFQNAIPNGGPMLFDRLQVLRSVPLHAYLDASFDHLPLGEPIGGGGAEVGEPILVSAGVLTEIVQRGDGRALRVTKNSELVTALGLRWELLDSTEIDTGIVVVNVVLTPEARDNFSWGLREQGGSTRSFFNFRLWDSGSITVFHAGSAGLSTGTYEGGQTLQALVLMNMDAGTYSVVLDGVLVVADRAHGISDRGVGSLHTNLLSSASNGRWFDLSHVLVLGPLPEAVFADGFE